jgi:hypothetical protein
MAQKKEAVSEIEILKINQGRLSLLVLGTTPIILNRMSEKAMRQLLFPAPKKNQVERMTTLKHDPMEEFRASPYIDRDPNGPTLVQHLASAFKGAMASTALDLPGTTKASLERLTWVIGDRVAIYGVPQLLMSTVRSADMNKTPDIRTRAIIPKWACAVTVAFSVPQLKQQGIANLMANAGIIRGVGDWRQEKGSGNYGSFELVEQGDARWETIVKIGGREAQIAAMENPEFYDQETADLYGWFVSEVKRRGFHDDVPSKKNGSKRGRGAQAQADADVES